MCQRWDATVPHIPKDKPENASFAENYCLPISDILPWCYTNDTTIRWQYCPAPICAEDDIFVPQDRLQKKAQKTSNKKSEKKAQKKLKKKFKKKSS